VLESLSPRSREWHTLEGDTRNYTLEAKHGIELVGLAALRSRSATAFVLSPSRRQAESAEGNDVCGEPQRAGGNSKRKRRRPSMRKPSAKESFRIWYGLYNIPARLSNRRRPSALSEDTLTSSTSTDQFDSGYRHHRPYTRNIQYQPSETLRMQSEGSAPAFTSQQQPRSPEPLSRRPSKWGEDASCKYDHRSLIQVGIPLTDDALKTAFEL
jgi:hypothetical protein